MTRTLWREIRTLHEFIRKENLVVVAEFVEARTAKEPGRPIFNAMMQRIQGGEAVGLLAWHPDRLARNSVDGGQIIYLLDTGQLLSLKCPTFWFEPTPQGKFMLSIAFGQSKYYVDNLRENILRGIRQKLRRGELPGKAPLGYLNEPRLRTIVIDPERASLVKRLFEAYATGRYTVSELRELVTQWGLRTREGRELSRTNMWYILGNPFYTGVFRINGEVYEGSHPPLISREFFEALFHTTSIASSENPAEIATFLKTTGSNLTLKGGKARPDWPQPYSLLANRGRSSNWWAVVAAVRTVF